MGRRARNPPARDPGRSGPSRRGERMHPKKLTRAWVAAGLLAAIASLTGGPAGAQEKKDSSPMATPDKTGAVSLSIGAQVRFQMRTKKPIKEAFNENDRVVTVLADQLDPSTLILIGRAVGSSRLELVDRDGARETYLVVVQRDLEMLRKLIRETIPTALVQVTPVGESGTGVVISGYVSREEDR